MLALLAASALALQPGGGAGFDRRAVLSFAPAAALFAVRPIAPASASYAMTQAAQSQHTWQATGQEKERAVYKAIESSIESKRRFSEEVGELGYVGGSYTKKSAAGRLANQFETESKADKKSANSYMQLPEELMMVRSRSLAQP